LAWSCSADESKKAKPRKSTHISKPGSKTRDALARIVKTEEEQSTPDAYGCMRKGVKRCRQDYERARIEPQISRITRIGIKKNL
jgi:hypothetical protein